MKIKGLDHIGILTQDIEASVAFYRDILGFRLKSRQKNVRADGSPFSMAFLSRGGCEIELVTAPAGFVPQDGTVAHIAIQCDDVDEVFRELVEKGCKPEWDAPVTEPFFPSGLPPLFPARPGGRTPRILPGAVKHHAKSAVKRIASRRFCHFCLFSRTIAAIREQTICTGR